MMIHYQAGVRLLGRIATGFSSTKTVTIAKRKSGIARLCTTTVTTTFSRATFDYHDNRHDTEDDDHDDDDDDETLITSVRDALRFVPQPMPMAVLTTNLPPFEETTRSARGYHRSVRNFYSAVAPLSYLSFLPHNPTIVLFALQAPTPEFVLDALSYTEKQDARQNTREARFVINVLSREQQQESLTSTSSSPPFKIAVPDPLIRRQTYADSLLAEPFKEDRHTRLSEMEALKADQPFRAFVHSHKHPFLGVPHHDSLHARSCPQDYNREMPVPVLSESATAFACSLLDQPVDLRRNVTFAHRMIVGVRGMSQQKDAGASDAHNLLFLARINGIEDVDQDAAPMPNGGRSALLHHRGTLVDCKLFRKPT